MRGISGGRHLVSSAILISVTFGVVASAIAEQDAQITRRAAAISATRRAVEELAASARAERAALERERRALDTQIEERRLYVEQMRGRVADLERRVAERRAEIARVEGARVDRAPALISMIDRVDAAMQRTLPFELDARRAKLAAIRRDVELGVTAPERALGQIWRVVEDDLQLGLDSGIHKHPVETSRGVELVEVARLGMVLMYWRADDGRRGVVARTPEGWRAAELTEAASKRAVDVVFEALERHQRGRVVELVLPSDAEVVR